MNRYLVWSDNHLSRYGSPTEPKPAAEYTIGRKENNYEPEFTKTRELNMNNSTYFAASTEYDCKAYCVKNNCSVFQYNINERMCFHKK